jgi:hypothetical protein
LYGTDAEVIVGPCGKQILIYQSMMKTKQQVFHALWHEFGHILFGDEKQYGINFEDDTPMRSGYAVFNEFVAEYIAYTVNDAEPFRNAMRSHIYLQMAFQQKSSIRPCEKFSVNSPLRRGRDRFSEPQVNFGSVRSERQQQRRRVGLDGVGSLRCTAESDGPGLGKTVSITVGNFNIASEAHLVKAGREGLPALNQSFL